MGLVDPPKGVWLESWLVYEVDDLERETYRALLQLVGWMWVVRKDGRPLRTTVRELAERWNVGERAVYSRLAAFRERGYLELDIQSGCVSVRLVHKQTNKQTHSGRAEVRESWDHGDERGDHGVGAKSGIINSGSGSDLDDPETLQQTTINRRVQCQLLECGVRPAAADVLARDEWVTVRRVIRWVEALEADDSVRSVPAVLYANLREHWEPPLGPDEQRREVYRQYAHVT